MEMGGTGSGWIFYLSLFSTIDLVKLTDLLCAWFLDIYYSGVLFLYTLRHFQAGMDRWQAAKLCLVYSSTSKHLLAPISPSLFVFCFTQTSLLYALYFVPICVVVVNTIFSLSLFCAILHRKRKELNVKCVYDLFLSILTPLFPTLCFHYSFLFWAFVRFCVAWWTRRARDILPTPTHTRAHTFFFYGWIQDGGGRTEGYL